MTIPKPKEYKVKFSSIYDGQEYDETMIAKVSNVGEAVRTIEEHCRQNYHADPVIHSCVEVQDE